MNVSTLDELRIGETFEFATTKPVSIGDVIGIKEQHGPLYGTAEITKNLGHGLYEARRIN